MNLDPLLVERFREDLEAVWPFSGTGEKLLLAVSGGPDSLAMLLLAHAAIPGQVEAATVDHRLRAAAAREAAYVAGICERLGVRHKVLEVDVAEGNLQAEARSARYDALAGWMEEREISTMATAHQLDDQAETFLMRLNRGSGLGGLAGIRKLTGVPGHEYLRLIRPVLGWRRSELQAVVDVAGIEAVTDPSNEDDQFDRVRMRKALASVDWLDIPAIARSAELLAHADASLDWVVSREWMECVSQGDGAITYRALKTGLGGDRVIRPALLVRIFRVLGATLDLSAAGALAANLESGKAGNVAGIHAEAVDVAGERLWQFRPENPRRTG
ncbi:tRNA lysidine(34) synthetase TilS [Qipengyuania sp. RANM35]|uniref:tRNA lysidine(34) synthetase TilS n=1 Tax=Qipengyuania sp. RANM35 TaxID=3068635 RepID=UPI0034DB2FE0